MDNRNVELDQLFASARNQVPEASFEETKKRFLGAVVLAAGGVLATKGIIHLFTKKWIIMMTIVSVATSATIVATTVTFGEPENQENNMIEPVSINKEEAPVLLEEQPDEETYQVQMNQPIENEQEEVVEEENEPEIVIVEEVVYPDHNIVWHCPPDTTDKKKDKFKKKDWVRFVAYSERFVITQNTTEAELEEIKKSAEQAGISFDYTAEYKKDKLDHLNINMSLSYEKNDRTSSMSESRDITNINKNDEIIVAWVEDEDGRAMVIGDQNSWDCDFDYEFDTGEYNEYMKDFERSMEEFEESMRDFEQMNFAFVSDSGCYVINMDCGNWANDFEIVIPEVPEIPMIDINMEMEELEEMLEDIDEMNEEVIEEIEEKLERLEQRLEELERELEEKHEKRERERREREEEKEDQDEEREKDE